jgi:Fe-Mn family superoxide dismutase
MPSRRHFTAAATTIQGSGWAILGWDTLGSRLLVHQLYDQQANLPAGQIPLVMLDMWERRSTCSTRTSSRTT